MIYIYSPREVKGLNLLIDALGAKRVSRFDGETFWYGKKRFMPEPGSILIPFGTTVPNISGVRVLNGYEQPRRKFDILSTLFTSNLAPKVGRAEGSSTYKNIIDGGLLPRQFKSRGLEHDLEYLKNHSSFIDYFVVKLNCTRQVRIHSFDGKSISAAQWVAGSNAHPWIRTEATGWKLDYFYKTTTLERATAHKAVKALELIYGVVDVGVLSDTSAKVLDVTTIPDISTEPRLKAYIKSIHKFIAGPEVTTNAI